MANHHEFQSPISGEEIDNLTESAYVESNPLSVPADTAHTTEAKWLQSWWAGNYPEPGDSQPELIETEPKAASEPAPEPVDKPLDLMDVATAPYKIVGSAMNLGKKALEGGLSVGLGITLGVSLGVLDVIRTGEEMPDAE